MSNMFRENIFLMNY